MRYGNLSRQLSSLAGPIFIETLLVMMLGAVDTFMLSRYSDNSVAAVGVVNQLMNLVFLLFGIIYAIDGFFYVFYPYLWLMGVFILVASYSEVYYNNRIGNVKVNTSQSSSSCRSSFARYSSR